MVAKSTTHCTVTSTQAQMPTADTSRPKTGSSRRTLTGSMTIPHRRQIRPQTWWAKSQASWLAMDRLVARDSQFIIATHSPILMAYPGARIYLLSEDGICRTAYRETEHYQLTRRFLEDPERMLRYLFGEED